MQYVPGKKIVTTDECYGFHEPEYHQYAPFPSGSIGYLKEYIEEEEWEVVNEKGQIMIVAIWQMREYSVIDIIKARLKCDTSVATK